MAAVIKKNDGNDAMVGEPNDKSQLARKAPPSYPTIPPKGPPGSPPPGRQPSGPAPRSGGGSGGSGFFAIYKKGQGYWTRMGTVGAILLIGVLTVNFLWGERESLNLHEKGAYIAIAAFSAIYAALAFYYVNKPGNVDFLIATDSEMKKVNWTSKKELYGSTKIVILFMFFIAVVLFVYDLIFHTFFWTIGVLKTPPPFFH